MTTSTKHLVLVDVSHMAYNFLAVSSPMTYTYNGQLVDTRIPAGILKNVWKWSRYGKDDVVVCFDRGCPARTQYFNTAQTESYKEGRVKNRAAVEGLNLTRELLDNGGVQTLAVPNFEADDLIGACVTWGYNKYQHIDVVTGDFDLVPLVDDKVSVFLRCRKTTYADDGRFLKNKYYEITPQNYEYLSVYWSKMPKIPVPYNTVLLQKMLQGDSSDNIKGIQYETKTGKLMRKYPDRKYTELLQTMLTDETLNLGECFRYTTLSQDAAEVARGVLSGYLPPEDVEVAMRNYYGMNLNGQLTDATGVVLRNPYVLSGELAPIQERCLSQSALQAGIHI